MGERIFDGNDSFIGGQNAGVLPHLIRPDQYFKGVNTTTVNGGLRPRPGVTEVEVQVESDTLFERRDGTKVTYQSIYKSGKFQGAGPYISESGKYIIATISGIIFQINPYTGKATVLTVEPQASISVSSAIDLEPRTQRCDQYTTRINWSEAGRFYTIFDYPDYPILIESGKVRRADPAKYEVFPSVLGTFNEARLFVASAVHEFTGGDQVGNRLEPNAPISFEEILIPAAPFPGQVFSLGSSNINNPITAMGSFPQTDDITGTGPLFVANNRAVYAYQTGLARADWENTKFGKLVLSKVGIAGQRAHVAVGGDIFFMSGQGRIHTFSVAQADQTKWSHIPMDQEVINWIKFNDTSLTPLTVVAHHNNRVFFTVNPYRAQAIDLDGVPVIDYAFRGFVALEFENLGEFLKEDAPAWAGLWTGLNPTEFVDLDGDQFIFSKDFGTTNSLYRMEPDNISFDTVGNKQKQLRSRIYFRDYTFEQAGGEFQLKEEVTIVAKLKEFEGDIKITIDRSVDSNPEYRVFSTFTHKAPVQREEFDSSEVMPVLAEHTFREINFGSPPDQNSCNLVTKEQLRYYGSISVRLTIEGRMWLLEHIRVIAETQEDDLNITNACDDGKAIYLEDIQDEIDDWDLYSTTYSQTEDTPCL